MRTQVTYYSGATKLASIFPVRNSQFAAMGGQRSKHNWYDGFSRLAGHPVIGPDAYLPVTRRIEYKSNPSLHKCGSKCRSAKGHVCECECGGEFHGVDA